MSPQRDVVAELAALARAEVGLERELTPEARLVEDLGLDSLRLMGLAVAVENHFRICLDEDDEGRLVTAGDLVAVIRAKLGLEPEAGAG